MHCVEGVRGTPEAWVDEISTQCATCRDERVILSSKIMILTYIVLCILRRIVSLPQENQVTLYAVVNGYNVTDFSSHYTVHNSKKDYRLRNKNSWIYAGSNGRA